MEESGETATDRQACKQQVEDSGAGDSYQVAANCAVPIPHYPSQVCLALCALQTNYIELGSTECTNLNLLFLPTAWRHLQGAAACVRSGSFGPQSH